MDETNGEAYVLKHNDDDNSAELLHKFAVRKTFSNDVVEYSDQWETFRLTITTDARNIGRLDVLGDGSGSIGISDMVCIKNQTIAFDRTQHVIVH